MQIGKFIPLNKTQITIEDVVNQVEDFDLWTNYVPLRTPCNAGDIIGIGDNGNQQFYIQKSQSTSDLEKPIILEEAKKAKLQILKTLYEKSQECIVTNCGIDTENGNIPIISKIIMRDTQSGGDLDLIARQKDLANDYGVSFIQLEGFLPNQDGTYSPTGASYCGYLLKSEWKSFYGDMINESSQNYITYQKLTRYIESMTDIATLQYITSNLESYFTIPYIIDLGSKVNRGNDAFMVVATNENLYTVKAKIYQIITILS